MSELGLYGLNSCLLTIKVGGTSLAVQWLRLCASTAGGTGSILGRQTGILHSAWHGQKNF